MSVRLMCRGGRSSPWPVLKHIMNLPERKLTSAQHPATSCDCSELAAGCDCWTGIGGEVRKKVEMKIEMGTEQKTVDSRCQKKKLKRTYSILWSSGLVFFKWLNGGTVLRNKNIYWLTGNWKCTPYSWMFNILHWGVRGGSRRLWKGGKWEEWN